jgi:hypothetical protein
VPVTAAPYYLTDPKIEIGPTATPIAIECSTTNIDHTIDQDENTTDTMCASYVSYGKKRHKLTITVVQSFGTDGLWNQLQPLEGTVVDFRVLPHGADPVGPDNPEMSGTAILKAIPFMSGAPNEIVDFDIELAIQGEPAYNSTGP